jgi:hypothetical protein
MRNTHIAVLTLAALSLAGCATAPGQLLVKPQMVDRPKLEVPTPQPVQQLGFEWVVINKDNAEAKFKEIEAKGGSVTFFALTPQGYQNLSMNVAELRRYIQQQNAVIAAMKKYYEAPTQDPKPTEDK